MDTEQKCLAIQKDIEEWMLRAQATIEKSKMKQQLANLMTMLKAFEPGSSSAETTQVLINFYKRMLSYI